MAFKIEDGGDDLTFLINGLPYNRGSYEIDYGKSTDDYFSLRNIGTGVTISEGNRARWVDSTDSQFSDLSTFATSLKSFFFKAPANGGGGETTPTVVTVNTSTYILSSSDNILHVTRTLSGSCVITIPSALISSGRVVTIKDAGYNSSANNITVNTGGSETIDNNVNWIINGNGDWLELYSDGSNLFIKG